METPFGINPESTYTVDEVAEILKYNRQVIIKIIKRGELSAYKLGRVYRMRGNHIIDYLNARFMEAKR